MSKFTLLVPALILILICMVSGQSESALYPTGISFQYGLGQQSVRDEFISKERYTGALPYISADWSKFHEKWGYRMSFEFRNATNIKNNNIAADVLQAGLFRDYIYPIGQKWLFGKDIYLFAGPTTGIQMYFNEQKIADQGILNIDFSLAMLFSLGVNSMIIIPFQPNLQLEGSMRLSLVAMGMRSCDVVEEDILTGDILTVLSAADPSAVCGVRYFIKDKLSIKGAYNLQVLSISKWNPLLSVSDILTLSISYHL